MLRWFQLWADHKNPHHKTKNQKPDPQMTPCLKAMFDLVFSAWSQSKDLYYDNNGLSFCQVDDSAY